MSVGSVQFRPSSKSARDSHPYLEGVRQQWERSRYVLEQFVGTLSFSVGREARALVEEAPSSDVYHPVAVELLCLEFDHDLKIFEVVLVKILKVR